MRKYLVGLLGLLACEPVPKPLNPPSEAAVVKSYCAPAVITKALEVNNVDSTVRITVLSREQGERQLVQLAKTATEEDTWMYYEPRHLWVDVGAAAFDFKDGKVTTSRDQCAIALLARGAESYHIHPDIVVFQVANKYTGMFAKTNFVTLVREAVALPSGDDLVRTSSEEYWTQKYGQLPRDHVVSALGVVDYSLKVGSTVSLRNVEQAKWNTTYTTAAADIHAAPGFFNRDARQRIELIAKAMLPASVGSITYRSIPAQ